MVVVERAEPRLANRIVLSPHATLTEAFALSVRYQQLPAWILAESDPDQFAALWQSFNLGCEQVARFRHHQDYGIYMRLGGINGKVYEAGRIRAYRTLDFAQLLINKGVLIERSLPFEGNEGKTILAKDGFGYKDVVPDVFDLACLRAQLEGTRQAFDANEDDYRAVQIIDNALQRDHFDVHFTAKG